MFVFGGYLPLFVVPPQWRSTHLRLGFLLLNLRLHRPEAELESPWSCIFVNHLSWWLLCWDPDSFKWKKHLGKCEHAHVEGGFPVVLPQINAMMMTNLTLNMHKIHAHVYVTMYYAYSTIYLIMASLRYTCHFLSFTFLSCLGTHAITQSMPHWTAVKQAPCNWKTKKTKVLLGGHHEPFQDPTTLNVNFRILAHLSFYPFIWSI